MSHEKVKLLYIASTGRAGSTILEMLLNTHPLIWTLGEFHILPWEIRTNRKPCGCGVRVEECPFWSPIIQKHRGTILDGSITRFRRAHNVDRALRVRELPFVGGVKFAASRIRSAQAEQYALDNETVLNAVREQASIMRSQPVQWLVDSSKSPYRLMWLAASGKFDLKVIHLTKDPRAFVYSMTKANRGLNRLYRAMRFSVRWQVQNRQVDAVIRNYLSPDHGMHLRYEELAARPEATMERIFNWLDVPFEPDATLRFRAGNHGIAGNPSRVESKPIQLDEKWKFELPAAVSRLSLLVNSGLARKYGHA